MLIIASSPNNTREIFYPQNNTIITLFLYLWHIKHHRHFYESINGGEPTCIDDDIPFDIPDSWEWCRLTSVCSFLSRGKSPKYSETEKKYPVFAQKCNLKEGGISLEKARFLDPKTIEKWQEVYKLQSGDILINSTGTGTVCRTRVFNESCLGHYPFTVPDSHVTVVRTFNAINSFFIFSFIEAVETQKYLEENLSGSTNQKELYIGVLENLLIPVPPAKEQGNIVNEIAALCKKLETISVSRRYYKRIRSETPTSLRQQLIQAAIQGQLVPQNPNDEPATILLERIAQERIAKQGKKAAKSMSRIVRRGSKTYELFPDGTEKDISDEIPFDIPEHWQWCRLDMAGTYRKGPFGSSLTKNHFVNKTTGCIKVYEQKNAIQKNHELGNYYISPTYYEQAMQAFDVGPSDIIVSCAGTIGEAYKLPSNAKKGIINQALMRIRLSIHINDSYFLRYFDYIIKMQAKESGKGSVIKNIPPFAVFKQLLMPVPPIQEQHRIVEKLSALLRLV